MSDWDLVLRDANVATMRRDVGDYGVIENAAVAIADGRIAWIGSASSLPDTPAANTQSLAGQWITPALIDCHTHLVFAGNRAAEFEMRLSGASYEDIARAGGGIMSTVRQTREASKNLLLAQSRRRLENLRAEGCATVEIKSGYGLDVVTEKRMLETAGELADNLGMSVSRTFLGAHAVPAEYQGKADDYIAIVCDEMLPAVHEAGLADSVDAYLEPIAFSGQQVTRVFERARDLGMPVRLHADQLSDSAGAELAASFGALSADHLEYTNQNGVKAMAGSGTVAVMLPGAFLTLGETQLPPIAQLRDHNVPIAVATDCNPGTSPVCSIRAAMTLATDLFRLTPAECLAGVTRNAARALGLDDRGVLESGMRADIATWDVEHPQELSYWIGTNELADLFVAGVRT